jgi:predicted XRE-type DNA-binding protein
MAIKAHDGSGNVFADLGFDPDEAANLQLRSDLMIQLRKRLTALQVTQADAAKVLGVSQPRVSDPMRGRIDRFSVDMLIKLLGKVDVQVRLTTRLKSRAACRLVAADNTAMDSDSMQDREAALPQKLGVMRTRLPLSGGQVSIVSFDRFRTYPRAEDGRSRHPMYDRSAIYRTRLARPLLERYRCMESRLSRWLLRAPERSSSPFTAWDPRRFAS